MALSPNSPQQSRNYATHRKASTAVNSLFYHRLNDKQNYRIADAEVKRDTYQPGFVSK